MPLSLYDTKTRETRPFEPADPNRVTMYVCGPTVYSYAHIGNARPAVVFDLLYRLLRREYGEGHVLYARNFTDVDDKIIAAAKQDDLEIEEVTEKFSRIYREDTAALGALPPTHEPTATGNIPAMISMIERLIAAGVAYETNDHVLFHVPAYADYGQLSRRESHAQLAGARVEVEDYKKDPADFVLWKPALAKHPGWDSPWGRGRPGWHIECSAMIETILGETIDIHGGGLDLVFPHHENEIAQSACVHDGAPLARVWMHNGMLTMADEKMSKSEGNVSLMHDLLKSWNGEVLRFALLSAHYRQPLDWTEALLAQSKATLDGWYRALLALNDVEATGDPADLTYYEPALAALQDDLNTPKAFAEISAVVARANKATERTERVACKTSLLELGGLLGVLQSDPETWFQGEAGDGPSAEEIEAALAARQAARKAKDFAEADRIRDDLAAQGVVIEDSAGGSTWRRE
jgi:cysteinyl-tRNA synthetase